VKPEFSIIPEKERVTLDPQRCFRPRQKAKLFVRSKGRCEICGVKITGKWIAGHYPVPHALGGKTTLDNGRVECMGCAEQTHADDTATAAKTRRMERSLKEGRGRKRKGPKLKSRNTLRKKK